MPVKIDTDRLFLEMARQDGQASKDPSTKVGACIVDFSRDEDGDLVAFGWNHFPVLIAQDDRLLDRDVKLRLMIHGEMAALLFALGDQRQVRGCTMYIVANGHEGLWGGPPCSRCAVHVIEAGIKEIVTYPRKAAPSRWASDLNASLAILREAGIGYREVPHP